jgi:hypothetical protein
MASWVGEEANRVKGGYKVTSFEILGLYVHISLVFAWDVGMYLLWYGLDFASNCSPRSLRRWKGLYTTSLAGFLTVAEVAI